MAAERNVKSCLLQNCYWCQWLAKYQNVQMWTQNPKIGDSFGPKLPWILTCTIIETSNLLIKLAKNSRKVSAWQIWPPNFMISPTPCLVPLNSSPGRSHKSWQKNVETRLAKTPNLWIDQTSRQHASLCKNSPSKKKLALGGFELPTSRSILWKVIKKGLRLADSNFQPLDRSYSLAGVGGH